MDPSAPIDISNFHRERHSLLSIVKSALNTTFSQLQSLSTSLSANLTLHDDCTNKCGDGFFGTAHKILSDGEEEREAEDLNIDREGAISFGHGPERWLYYPKPRLFDLTRQASSKVLLPSRDDHISGLLLDPSRTILVIVDMQNYFIHPSCCSHPGGLAAVVPILQVMNKFRAMGIQIAYLNWVIDHKDLEKMPPAVQRGWSAERFVTEGVGWHVNLGSELPDGQGRCLWTGSWNAELYAPIKAAAHGEDVTFLKNRPSGMWDPSCDMARYLVEHNKKTVLFAGVNSDQCVLGTLTDCYHKSYDCILISDCVATATTGLMAQELVEWNVARNYGFVVQSDCILNSRLVNP